jgi:hypothetical protein
MEIARGKEWAEGLTQDEFIPEFTKRHPKSDAIPLVEKWIVRPYTKGSTERLLSKQARIKPPESEKPKDEIACSGCKKVFKGKPRYAHLANHKKKCVDYQNQSVGG